MTHWHTRPDGLRIYAGGKLVAVIPPEQFSQLLVDLARALQATRAPTNTRHTDDP